MAAGVSFFVFVPFGEFGSITIDDGDGDGDDKPRLFKQKASTCALTSSITTTRTEKVRVLYFACNKHKHK